MCLEKMKISEFNSCHGIESTGKKCVGESCLLLTSHLEPRQCSVALFMYGYYNVKYTE